MKILRLFDKNGKHRLTIMDCCEDPSCVDMCTPDGKVIFCENKKDSILMDVFKTLEDTQEVLEIA